MALGVYGSKTLSDVSIDEVDILFAFSPSREELGEVEFKPLFSNITDADLKKMLGADGLYKLRLPANTFNQIGFYSVLMKPKTIETTILDCSFIVTNDNNRIQISRKGIVIPALQFQNSSSLVGYQIQYFDKNDVKIKNLNRIVTGSELVSVSTNNNSVNNGSNSYILDPNGTSLFLTLTPDEGSIISNNSKVDIGTKGQRILITNTFFDPVFIEVEMVDQTLKTLSYALYGNSTRDLETGILTYFDDNNSIYRQFNLFNRKKEFSRGSIDVKEQRNIINLDQDFQQLSQGTTV